MNEINGYTMYKDVIFMTKKTQNKLQELYFPILEVVTMLQWSILYCFGIRIEIKMNRTKLKFKNKLIHLQSIFNKSAKASQ